MARPPSGPIGNAPRDVRDDFIGAPPDPVKGEPPRWPPKPKRITTNTFHAKVSGNTPPKRADRSPHYRKGGWVSGYATGGAVVPKSEKKEDKREILPGAQKNDPMALQNLRGKPAKHQDVPLGKAPGYKKGGGVKKA
jgi:hypothetical protein